MTKIYIDTNIFLDFYQSSTDRLSVFEEIERHSKSIVLTEQTVNEFRRNKNARLNELAKNVKQASSVKIHTTALIQSLPEFKAWNEVKQHAEELAKQVSQKLLAWAQDESNDPVNTAFEKLVKESKLFRTSSASIEKAKTRKLLGEPPTSPDKYTIGDELIWETILESCREDLIILSLRLVKPIPNNWKFLFYRMFYPAFDLALLTLGLVVSRDKTFLENVGLLKSGYQAETSADLLTITPKLSDAFNLIGTPAKAVEKAEREIEENKVFERFPFALTLSTKCPKCGGELEETGFEGSDGDSAWWVFCTRCGTEYFPNQFAQ
jgi:predicted nucleic acid-binding protein